MTFTVTYRNRDGLTKSKSFEAESRPELFKILKASNINPIRVEEGHIRQSGKGLKHLSTTIKKIMLAVTAVAIVVLILVFFVSRTDSSSSQTRSIKPSSATFQPQAPVQTNKVIVPKSAEPQAVKDPVAEKKPYVKKPGQMQLPSGEILTFPKPKEGETRKVYAHGRTYECDHLGNFRDITPRKLFKTAFELNFLGLAQEGKPYIPAFLTGLDESAVKKMLLKNYEKIGDETPEEMQALKAYDDMRCAALEYMEQGGKFDDFVTEYAKFDRDQRQSRALCVSEVMKLYREGKVDEAYQTACAANELMEKKEFKPIVLPPRIADQFNTMTEQQSVSKE